MSSSRASFLQSPEWEEIQKKMGRPVKRIGPVLVIKHDLPFGFNYIYAPRPERLGDDFFSEVKDFAGENRSIFLKIDPADSPYFNTAQYLSMGGRKAFSLQAPATVVIDCKKSEEELLSAMHPKTRYNIRLAERKGVKVRRLEAADVPEGLERFWNLVTETARRDKFCAHPKEHYRCLLETASGDFENQLWFAEHGDDLIAAAIVNVYRPSGTAAYLHGASVYKMRELMAPHLLHWEMIRETRIRGFEKYDLGGIDEQKWPGITRFKKGFGGDIVSFPEARDFVFREGWYALYALRRRFLRGD